jgi:hypothetical protein
MPPSIFAIGEHEGPYTANEMLAIVAGDDWEISDG